jgi:hypothetical protein
MQPYSYGEGVWNPFLHRITGKTLPEIGVENPFSIFHQGTLVFWGFAKTKTKTVCSKSDRRVEDHFVGSVQMVESGTMPEELPTAESIKKLESKTRKALKGKNR